MASAPFGDDWFYRPVERGLCTYTELVYGELSLFDVAEMNDIIALKDENARRVEEALSKWQAAQ